MITLPAHEDNDRGYTIFLTLWPHDGNGGEFYHAGTGAYFSPKHGDILLFNGKKKHGSCKTSNFKLNEHKITMALFN